MSGGIIIQRASVLIPAVMAPAFYDTLRDEDKVLAKAISDKGAGACTKDDTVWMAKKLYQLEREDCV